MENDINKMQVDLHVLLGKGWRVEEKDELKDTRELVLGKA